jgi:hypothetical protein
VGTPELVTFHFNQENLFIGAGGVAQWYTILLTCIKALGSIPSTIKTKTNSQSVRTTFFLPQERLRSLPRAEDTRDTHR